MHARDGAEALEIMRKTPPDVITLDVMMPQGRRLVACSAS